MLTYLGMAFHTIDFIDVILTRGAVFCEFRAQQASRGNRYGMSGVIYSATQINRIGDNETESATT